MNIIKENRERLGLSQRQLASKAGVNVSSISRWERGDVTNMERDSAAKLALILNISPSEILGFTDETSTEVKGIKIPVLGYIRAGVPFEAVEDIIDYEEISPDLAGTGEFFCLQIKGQSMEPKISEGDVIVVRKQDTVDNGDVAVVLVNGSDATVKKFYKTDKGVKLVANNPAFEPLFYTCDEVSSLPVTVIGKAIELRAKL